MEIIAKRFIICAIRYLCFLFIQKAVYHLQKDFQLAFGFIFIGVMIVKIASIFVIIVVIFGGMC